MIYLQQWAHVVPGSWFLKIFVFLKGPGLPGQKADWDKNTMSLEHLSAVETESVFN